MEFAFVKYSGDKIVIKRKDGRSFAVSPSLFSAADQKYLADLKNIEMIWVKSGNFMRILPPLRSGADPFAPPLPSETLMQKVILTKGFYLGKYEITQVQWESVMGNNPSKSKGATRPVDGITWSKAMTFCRKLTQLKHKEGTLPKGKIYQLPTEAEWEYACRAGTTTAYWWGNTFTKANAKFFLGRGNGKGGAPFATALNPALNPDPFNPAPNRRGDGQIAPAPNDRSLYFHQTCEVGKFPANPWGFHDMHGNAAEWCSDKAGPYLGDEVTDPTGPIRGTRRIVRGSAWNTPARSDKRLGFDVEHWDLGLGLRIALKKTN